MARRKSIFDRYTYDQLQRFRDEYRRELEMGETNRGRAAAGAGLEFNKRGSIWLTVVLGDD